MSTAIDSRLILLAMPDGEEVRYRVEMLGAPPSAYHLVGPCPGCYMRARNHGETLQDATRDDRVRWTLKREHITYIDDKLSTQRRFVHAGCFEGHVQRGAWVEVVEKDPR